MADVARLAGVSQMTVSRVINDTAPVRGATRARVEKAMRELDYQPNVAARTLASGRSRVLGVVAFNSTLFGPASTLFGIEEAARAAGYFVSVDSLRTLDAASITAAVERLRAQSVDGVVIMAPTPTATRALREVREDIPVVAVQGGGGVVPSVTIDQRAGAARATRHLLSLGHKTVVHMSGPASWIEARERRDAWHRVLQEEGREIPPVLEGDWTARSGYELGRELLDRGDVTAVFAANDHIALGLYRAISEVGLSVPDDVSIVGFDDIPEAAYFAPPLTTVHQDFAKVGALSLAGLVAQIEGAPREADSTTVDANLVVRASTGPPPT